MNQRERHIAAEDGAALARKAAGEAFGKASRRRQSPSHRARYRRSGRKSRAGRRAIRARQSAAAPTMHHARGRRRHARAALANALAHRRRSLRRLRCGRSATAPRARSGRASEGSCVTRISVMPRSTWPLNRSSTTPLTGLLVEIAGRLVGDKDRGIGRKRARERHALLLAARQLRRVMRQPFLKTDAGQLCRGPFVRRQLRRPVPAGRRRSRARSWSESDGRTERRCRHCGRGSGRGHPRRAWSGLHPRPRSSRYRSRSSPARTISSVDLPDPEGPTRPIASPRPIARLMSLRM